MWIRPDIAGSEPAVLLVPPSTYVSQLKKEACKEFKIDEHILVHNCRIVNRDVVVEATDKVAVLQHENCGTSVNPLILQLPTEPPNKEGMQSGMTSLIPRFSLSFSHFMCKKLKERERAWYETMPTRGLASL